MQTRSRKSALRHRKESPIWLRRLDRVKAELAGTRFPATAVEGFRECLMLSATALQWLEESIRDGHPRAGEAQLELKRRRLLARMSAAEARWLAKWTKERTRYFNR